MCHAFSQHPHISVSMEDSVIETPTLENGHFYTVYKQAASLLTSDIFHIEFIIKSYMHALYSVLYTVNFT